MRTEIKCISNKLLITILMCLNMSSCANNKQTVKSCLSEDNFDIVHQYIHDKIPSKKDFYTYNGCDIYLSKEGNIVLKNDGLTMAIIMRSKGIFSLAKLKSDNERQREKASELFCQLLDNTKNE